MHANGDLSISGNPIVTGIPLANGTATASGEYSTSGNPVVTGESGGGFARKSIPAVRASFYQSWANFILEDSSIMTDADGNVLCDASANQNACRVAYGWRFSSGTWELDNDAANGTVYVETGVSINGSPGSVADPVDVTILAEGSIEISGNPHLTPANSEILFVTDGDLKINGNLEIHLAEGQILVHEQLQISGNPVLLGQIVVEDAASDDSLVTESRISGNPSIIYNGDVGTTLFAVRGWREVR